MTSFDKIAEQLFECLKHAPAAELTKLADLMKQTKGNHTRTWNGVRQQPAARKLLDAMLEASEIHRTSDLEIKI